MATGNNDIWSGDKLGRKAEARVLERFFTAETIELRRMRRDQAIVLALDAQYGEGKSWFLSRFRQQIQANHPVAFVDAWVDDANSEPLVSIMAALDHALKPFLKSKSVRENFGAMARAALPIIGKGAVAASGKFISKYLGDQIGGDVKQIIDSAKKSPSSTEPEESPLDAGLEELTTGVAEVVDSAGKALLDQYRARQNSRDSFKANLKSLASSIDKTDTDSRQSPIFIIVDELDRCRPSYAISLLEEIKHLFDVPGLVFIIALHGEQLTKSIEAVYGQQFDAKSYLRRFFTRHYKMRRLKLDELVDTWFDEVPYNEKTFSYPAIWTDEGKIGSASPARVAGLLLTEWKATPREVQSVVDALRLFVSQWPHKGTPIELPFALVLLLNLIRGDEVAPHLSNTGIREITFTTPAKPGSYDATPGKAASHEFFDAYTFGSSHSLPYVNRSNHSTGVRGYAVAILGQEFRSRFSGAYQKNYEPLSTWAEYATLVAELGRFVEPATERQD